VHPARDQDLNGALYMLLPDDYSGLSAFSVFCYATVIVLQHQRLNESDVDMLGEEEEFVLGFVGES
jgi:hypothetical protein